MIMAKKQPYQTEDNDYTPEAEIYSHSSFATNRRLDILFTDADYYNVNTFQNPTLDNIKAYFSVVKAILGNVFCVLTDDKVKAMVKLRNEFYKKFLKFDTKADEETQLTAAFEMYFLTEHLHQLIIGYLQMQMYFFRIGHKDPKGLEKAIAIIEKGGGVFGGQSTAEDGSE